MENVAKLLPRLNINPNFASPQLLLLACILRCLYSVTLSQEFSLCLCGRHCIGKTPRETLLTQPRNRATDCVMPGRKRQTKWGTGLWQWRSSLLPSRRVIVKTTSPLPQKSLTGVVDLKLPPLFPSHPQLSEILPVLIQIYLSSGHLSGLDFSDEVRFGSGKVADLLTTFSESILSVSLLERGTESWVLPVG